MKIFKRIVLLIVAVSVLIVVFKLQNTDDYKETSKLQPISKKVSADLILNELKREQKILIYTGTCGIQDTRSDNKWYGDLEVDFDLSYTYGISYDFSGAYVDNGVIKLPTRFLKLEYLSLDLNSDVTTDKGFLRDNLPSENIDYYLDEYYKQIKLELVDQINSSSPEYMNEVKEFVLNIKNGL